MVIQKNTNEIDTNKNVVTLDAASSSTWSLQTPAKIINIRSTSNMQAKPPITRQIAISTLAAMHRRFSLPGPVQPHSRPIAEFRASANKSLDMLRQTVQSAVTREIDQVIKKYLEKFFVPAVNNIRLNLGDESVSEDQVRAVCRAMLDATRLLYSTPPRVTNTGLDTIEGDTDKLTKQTIPNPLTNKRKEPDLDTDLSQVKKIKQEDSCDSGSASPVSFTTVQDPEKWNPARLTQDTLFIMGSHAHKVLGLGNSRGRLYTRHAGLLRYPADSADKEWIASHNLANAVGGKTYIMVLEDIEELAASDAYKHSSLPLLGELTGFKVPPFLLRKIKAYVLKKALCGDISNANSPQPSTSNQEDKFKIEDIKLEVHDDFDSANFNASQYITNSENSRDFGESIMKEDSDFADIKVEDIDDIKVDGIKMEDLDEIKVDGIKVEDLEANGIKVENIDDINVDGIKVEDIKLENEDAFDLCKETDDENHLVDGLFESDIEFLSRNLCNIESDADARKTIEKLTGANPDTITLVGDEFDLGTTLNTSNFSGSQSKCITVASTTSGMIHSVPVAHIAPPRITGNTLHYYSQPARLHLPQATLTIQGVPRPSHMIRGIPFNAKSGTISTVMSQGTASIIGIGTRSSNATIIGSPQYVNVCSKSFPTGNILHNAIVSKNIVNRSTVTSGVSFNVTSVRPSVHTSSPKSTVVTVASDFDSISTTKDMIDNACNSSVMLKKVLTLGSSGSSKSFVMHNTQKVLSTGFANGISPPPNVTIVSAGNSGGILNTGNLNNIGCPTSGNLSATHATLSALLSSKTECSTVTKN
ncbi:putative terminal deoxynucleotidyltransferase interacting factor 1 [Danaus plexippus plexippus]|uniref:Terminal deoxynucleotidyltransferase interacting factor 1 n=1 Tax=Danaus plexippus plexippus TaxID=278856 RepID=A0A212F0Z6_DANPL|nr:putative terminal deoxynucleotidyltransferase interacting factor 1 [Danaus plexippus plexippus]